MKFDIFSFWLKKKLTFECKVEILWNFTVNIFDSLTQSYNYMIWNTHNLLKFAAHFCNDEVNEAPWTMTGAAANQLWWFFSMNGSHNCRGNQ